MFFHFISCILFLYTHQFLTSKTTGMTYICITNLLLSSNSFNPTFKSVYSIQAYTEYSMVLMCLFSQLWIYLTIFKNCFNFKILYFADTCTHNLTLSPLQARELCSAQCLPCHLAPAIFHIHWCVWVIFFPLVAFLKYPTSYQKLTRFGSLWERYTYLQFMYVSLLACNSNRQGHHTTEGTSVQSLFYTASRIEQGKDRGPLYCKKSLPIGLAGNREIICKQTVREGQR